MRLWRDKLAISAPLNSEPGSPNLKEGIMLENLQGEDT